MCMYLYVKKIGKVERSQILFTRQILRVPNDG